VKPEATIEALATRLVQEAPVLEPSVLDELREALQQVGSPLALAIARIYEFLGHGLVDPAIALPALAEACATLVMGIEGKVGQRELEAARYQVDTLTPMPDKPKNVHAAPDVPLTSLKRK
jgi:hypothetical protein